MRKICLALRFPGAPVDNGNRRPIQPVVKKKAPPIGKVFTDKETLFVTIAK